MIWDAGMPIDFDENGIKFVDLLDGMLDGNKVIFKSRQDLKALMEEAGLPTEGADYLINKVQECGALEDTAAPGYLAINWICVKGLKKAIAEKTCPVCKKHTLQVRRILVKCCKNCGERIEAEEEKQR